ncbi:MAG: hypothetical protein HGA65_18550 [Oscillochloris sp.]|nr:hypothetical protein [Oscillochloris sp.]
MQRRSALVVAVLALLVGWLLAGCANPPDDLADDAATGVGRSSPEAAVDGFLEDLNFALRDPSLITTETQRSWAERLAGYFAPGERLDQRVAFSEMLAGFADTIQNPVVGAKATLEITYSRLELISRNGDSALVRVVDGSFHLRWLNVQGDVVRERTGGLTDVIGQQSGGIPVIQVDRLWFLTEG